MNKFFAFSRFFILLFLFGISKVLNDYIEPSQEFRGVWVSPFSNDISYNSESDFKEKMNFIFDTIKEYKMNALIFHVRIKNDALYKSKYNPQPDYIKKVLNKEFDPLKWVIEESHLRGIEFHAWLNPYRVETDLSKTDEEIISKYIGFPDNPANDKNNILRGGNSIILNPGLQIVRDFLVKTILELINNYDDIDAIHFDDYFFNKISTPLFSQNKAIEGDWRREQVNLLIQSIHENITLFNKKYNKYVQFGISPTGVYKNGDGIVTYDNESNAITKGSSTIGQQHFSELFCDSLEWIKKGYINYLIPQTYWAHDHPNAQYNKVVSWWNKVFLNKKTNLFMGIGLYKCNEINSFGWLTNENELYNQLTFNPEEDENNQKEIDGFSIFKFSILRKLKDGDIGSICSKQIKNGIEAWKMKVPPSKIKSFDNIILPAPKNIKFENKTLRFNKVDNAKFYVIYRSKDQNISFNSSEIVEIFGSKENEVTWDETEEGNFTYGVKALSYANTLGEGNTNLKSIGEKIKFNILYSFILLYLLS